MLSLPTAIHRKSCFLRSMHTVSLDWISQSRQLHMLHLVLQNILYEWPKLGANWIKGELGTNQPIYTTETDSHDTENRHVLVMEDGEGEGWIGTLGLVSQSSRSVVSNSLWPHEPQHARPPCPSPTPRVHPNPCPLSQWCHPTISSSVVPFSSCPQSFSASGSFQISQLFASGGQSIGVSASASVPPMNTLDWDSKGLSRVFSNTTVGDSNYYI